MARAAKGAAVVMPPKATLATRGSAVPVHGVDGLASGAAAGSALGGGAAAAAAGVAAAAAAAGAVVDDVADRATV